MGIPEGGFKQGGHNIISKDSSKQTSIYTVGPNNQCP